MSKLLETSISLCQIPIHLLKPVKFSPSLRWSYYERVPPEISCEASCFFCYMLWVSWPPPALPTINQSNFYSRLFSSGFPNVFSAPRNVSFHYILKIKTYMLKARVMESTWESSIIKIELAPQFLPLELHPCSIIDPHVRCLPCEFSRVGFIFSISMQEHMLLCIIDANMHVWCK